MRSNAIQIKKRHSAVEQLRDASLAWVLEIEGEVDEKVGGRKRRRRFATSRSVCCLVADKRITAAPRSALFSCTAKEVDENRKTSAKPVLSFRLS